MLQGAVDRSSILPQRKQIDVRRSISSDTDGEHIACGPLSGIRRSILRVSILKHGFEQDVPIVERFLLSLGVRTYCTLF